MPVYEYACGKCGHEFEAEQRITEAPLKTCPRCRARKLQRLISQTSFVLKGGGWYSDLYGSKPPKDSAQAKDAAPAAAETSGASAPASEAGSPAAATSDAGDAKPKTKREGKRGKSKRSKAAA